MKTKLKLIQDYLKARKEHEKLKEEFDVVLPPMVPDLSYRSVSNAGNWATQWLQTYKLRAELPKLLKRKVAVIVHDTAGRFDHKFLRQAAWNELGYNTTADPLTDKHGHGTHCGGIYGAIDPSQPIGVAEVMVKAGLLKIIPAKCLNDRGAGSWTGIDKSIEIGENIAMDLRKDGWFVIHSMSLGGNGSSNRITNTIQKAIANGSVFVVAAGNTGREGMQFPARVPGVLSFGSHDKNGRRSSFSTYDPKLFAAAPGQSILSTIPGDKLASWSGTSMATPAGGAIIALLASIYPELDSSKEMEAFVREFATDIMEKGMDKYTGIGSPIITPYLGKQIDEDPDEKPEDPVEEEPPKEDPIPEPEEPTKPQAVTLNLLPTYAYQFSRNGTSQGRFKLSGTMQVEFITKRWLENASDELVKSLQDWMGRSGIVIGRNHDQNDAAGFLAWFTEMQMQRKYNLRIKVTKLECRDDNGRAFELTPSRHWTKASVASIKVSEIGNLTTYEHEGVTLFEY